MIKRIILMLLFLLPLMAACNATPEEAASAGDSSGKPVMTVYRSPT